MAWGLVGSFKIYFMDTENNKEANTGSGKEKSSSRLHSGEVVTRVGSTEHNDYRIKGSDDKKQETANPRNDQGHSEEHGAPMGQ
jgi:hypothetical protein